MTVSPKPKSMANNGYARPATSRVRTQIHAVSTVPPAPPAPPGETVSDKPTDATPPPQAGLFGSGGTVRARVICAGTFGAVDDVVEVAAELAAQSDELDADPAAVAYAESLQHGPA